MAVKIRLKRIGKKKTPYYRIVVADSHTPRNGKFIEDLGFYDPKNDPATISVDIEKAKDWIKKGAQPTETVKSIINKVDVDKK